MTPTPAQIEAALEAFHKVEHSDGLPARMSAALTAAAEIGGDEVARLQGKINQAYSLTEDLLAILDNRSAAAEVGDYELKCTHGHDKCEEMYPSEDCPYCERVPVAAGIGEPYPQVEFTRTETELRSAVLATIERCAQVVDDYAIREELEPMFDGCAAAIRALKDK